MSESEAHAPMLRPRQDVASGSPRTEATLAALLGRVTGRRAPSMMVRETAARELEERRADWGFSRPVVFLDMLWNAAFVVVSVAMLSATTEERPNTPVRFWICGYALQCLVHVALVWMEFRRRSVAGLEEDSSQSSITKRCESVNTMVSVLWWIVGFYWVVSGGDALLDQAPRLYWLTVIFLSFDVFFAIFCVVLACLIGIALCCCLPCIIAILYAVAGQEGASEADLSILPRYRFQEVADEEKSKVGAGKMMPVESSSGNLTVGRVLLGEDAECCICLVPYEDGAELHALPCNHHFHSTCIVKWLKMNATCPLCKYNILKGHNVV